MTTQELPAQEREAFEAWYDEIENFATRGERLAELGWREAMYAAWQAALLAHLAQRGTSEPVAWRFKERINDEFDSDWILTKYEPADGVRIIAKEPLCAHPPIQQVEPVQGERTDGVQEVPRG